MGNKKKINIINADNVKVRIRRSSSTYLYSPFTNNDFKCDKDLASGKETVYYTIEVFLPLPSKVGFCKDKWGWYGLRESNAEFIDIEEVKTEALEAGKLSIEAMQNKLFTEEVYMPLPDKIYETE